LAIAILGALVLTGCGPVAPILGTAGPAALATQPETVATLATSRLGHVPFGVQASDSLQLKVPPRAAKYAQQWADLVNKGADPSAALTQVVQAMNKDGVPSQQILADIKQANPELVAMAQLMGLKLPGITT